MRFTVGLIENRITGFPLLHHNFFTQAINDYAIGIPDAVASTVVWLIWGAFDEGDDLICSFPGEAAEFAPRECLRNSREK